MLLKRLRLTNFRQFREADIEFERGLTAIVGPNGSGKTTILEAIAWVLYGEQRGAKATLRHKWAEDPIGPEVTLEFSLGKRHYIVERDPKTAAFKEMTPEGEVVQASGLTAVCEESQRVLGLTYEQFKNSFCTEQKQLEFLKFGNQERKQEEVARMLGYDALRVAGKIAEKRATEAKAELRGLEEALAAGVDREAELRTAKEAHEQTAKQMAELTTVAEALIESLTAIEPKRLAAIEALDILRQMEERRDVGRTLKTQRDDLIAKSEALKEQEKERASLEPLAKECDEVRELVAKLHRQVQEAAQRKAKEEVLAGIKDEIAKTQQALTAFPLPDIDKATQGVGLAQSALDGARDVTALANAEWQSAKAQAEAAVRTAAQLIAEKTGELNTVEESEKRGICSLCGQPLPDGHAPRSAQLSVELAAIVMHFNAVQGTSLDLQQPTGAVQSAITKEGEAATALKVAQDAHLEVQKLAHQRSELAKKAEGLAAGAEATAKEISQLPAAPDSKDVEKKEARLAELTPSRDRFLQLSEIPERRADNDRALANANEAFETERLRQQTATARLAELAMDQPTAEATLADNARLNAEAQQTSNQLELRQNDLKKQELIVATAERELAELAEKRKQARSLESVQLLNSHLDKGMSELRQRLNQDLPHKLCAYASESLASLTGGRYLQIKMDDKFNARLVDDEDVEKEVISGGEEDIVALALRMGLTAMMQESGGQPMSLLILDEVFGSLDDERRVHVMEMLDTLRGMFEQILFISHVDEVRNAADRWLEVRYDRANKTSEILVKERDIQLLEARQLQNSP